MADLSDFLKEARFADMAYEYDTNNDPQYREPIDSLSKWNDSAFESNYSYVDKFNDLTDQGGAQKDMQLAIYKSTDNNEIVITFRGTEFGNAGRNADITSDVDYGWNQWQENKTAAMAKIEAVITANPDASITLTGHSLGGMLAQYAAYDILNTHQGKTVDLTTFGAPGVLNRLVDGVNERGGETYNSSVLNNLCQPPFRSPVLEL